MLTRRRFISSGLRVGAGMAAVSSATAVLTSCTRQVRSQTPAAPTDRQITGPGSLKAHAAAHGHFVGAAVDVNILRADATYARVLREQYNMIVAENAMKWELLRPAPDRFFFDDADALVTFAHRNKMKVRGHNLAWHQQLPKWFSTTVNKDNAQHFLTEHIMTVAGHYRRKIHSWDVVNEAINPPDGRPDGLRKSPWFELLGPSYIDIAFRTARQADPQALLTYNDYGVENENEGDAHKRELILQMLRRMKADNVPLDAVGIQGHIHAGGSSKFGPGIREFVASAREMGLQVFVTELDVNEDDLPVEDDVTQRDHAIAGAYHDFLTTVLPDPALKAVLTWGVTDRHTWLNGIGSHQKKRPNRQQRALPFDSDYQPKEAFFAMRDCFDGRAA